MNYRYILLNLFLFSFLLIISACSASNSVTPETNVEKYLQALVEKDEAALSNLSCSDWEMDALMELDSLQAVEVELEALECRQSGQENDFILVNCQGFMVATYNGENQKIDLSLRTYQVLESGSNFLVCGYK